jgi:hypothetical protein
LHKDSIALYLFNIFLGTTINISSGAIVAEKSWCDVSQGQKTAIAISFANDNLVTLARGAFGKR